MSETTLFEYYDHSIMSEVNREFTPELMKELKSFMVKDMLIICQLKI
ncbi:MAG: hypothetical protein CM15mV11_3170 [Caudoviricetes sp.]|nr:MAG: hypothetical protein CM15mV11_3170 [Caudoviricetes sp.]